MKPDKQYKRIIIVLSVIILLICVRLYFYVDIKWTQELNNTISSLRKQNRLPKKSNIIPKKIPDNQNAAIDFEQIFKLMTNGHGGKPFNRQGKGTINTNLEAILKIKITDKKDPFAKDNTSYFKDINSNNLEEIIKYLNQASVKPYLNFYLDFDAGPNMLLPHLYLMRMLYRIISIKALYDAKQGKITHAYKLLLKGLKSNNLLAQEPIIISQLVRIANDSILIETLESIISKNNISNNEAEKFIQELKKHNEIKPFIKIVDTEIVFMGMYIYEALLNGNEDLGWNSIRNILDNPKPLNYLPTFVLKPLIKKDYTEYLKRMNEFKIYLKTPYWKLSEERLNKLLNSTESLPAYCIICNMIMPSLTKLIEKIADYRTKIDKAILLLAIKIYENKYKTYPRSINELVPKILTDIPINYRAGEPLIIPEVKKKVK